MTKTLYTLLRDVTVFTRLFLLKPTYLVIMTRGVINEL